jgi:ubiquinone/menaquinone biosynthesis C-methylase UbiE
VAALSERDRKESNGELKTIILDRLTEDSRGTLLDIGGGTGLLTETLLDVFDRVVVLDSDLRKVEYGAKRRHDVEFIRGSAQQVPIAGGSVGTLVSVAAFHHFPDQDAALEEMGRALKPKGRLLLVEIDVTTVRGKLLRFTENGLMGGRSKFLAPDRLLEKVRRHRFSDVSLDRTSRGYVVVGTRAPDPGVLPSGT